MSRSWHVFFQSQATARINVVSEKISAHSVVFLVNQAVNSHYSHYIFILFVTNGSNIYRSDSSHIVIYISYSSPLRSRLRDYLSTIIQFFESIKSKHYYHTSYRTYSVTAARQTYNLKKKCSNPLRAIIISVWNMKKK